MEKLQYVSKNKANQEKTQESDEEVETAEEQLKNGTQKEKDKSKTKKQRDRRETCTKKSKLQDISQDNATEEEGIEEKIDDVIPSEFSEEVETTEEQLREDTQERESSQSRSKERQKRYSYLERAFKKPPKKKVQIEEPIESPDTTTDKIIESEEHKIEEYKIEDHHNLSEDTKEHVVNVVAGSLSGFLSTGLAHPLGEIKRRTQIRDHGSIRRCIWQEVRVRYAEKGLRVFWKGHTRRQITGIFHNITLFWTFNEVMTAFEKVPAIDEYEWLQNFTAGFCSGASTTIVVFPIDHLISRIAAIVRIRRRFHKVDLRPLLKFDARHMFYRGILPTLLYKSLNYGYKFLFYNMLCDHVFAKAEDQERDDIPSGKLLLAGATAGVLSHSLTYPLDLITRRIQTPTLKRQSFTFDRNCRTLLQCFLLVMRTDGFSGLYRGYLPVVLMTTVNTSVMFAVFDKMHKYMEEEI